MSQEINHTQPSQQETIDIKSLLFRFWGYRFLFLIVVILGLAIAWLINRYSTKIYKTEAIVMIADDNSNGVGAGMEGLMTAIGYYNPRLQFENEVIVLESRSLIERTLSKLDFGIEYQSLGRLKVGENYGEKLQARVIFDTAHIQPLNTRFEVEYVAADEFTIKQVEDNIQPYYFNDSKIERGYLPEGTITGTYKVGQWIETNYARFKEELRLLTIR